MGTKELKREMIKVYGELCWMNKLYIPTKNNMLTFHHILEKRNGGLLKWENGALLSRKSHDYLNKIELYFPDEYNELNNLFLYLNKTYSRPTNDYYEEVEKVLRRTRW